MSFRAPADDTEITVNGKRIAAGWPAAFLIASFLVAIFCLGVFVGKVFG